MRIRKGWMACLTGAAACSLLFTAAALSQQSKDKPAGSPPPLTPEQQKMMKAMEAYGAINENHGYLKQFAGDWDLKIVFWMEPGAPAVENKSTSSAKLIHGGRQLVEKVTGTMDMGDGSPPMPFEGMSLIGFDNSKKKFFSIWTDNMCTGLMTEWGTASQGGKVFTFEGDNYCAQNDKICKTKSVVTITDPNTRKLEMWGPDTGGNNYKAMEITYTRKK